uniref:Reverse transcriptase zinc-binding domain-containing protein n=1 Tax=Lactuca sativa TaxID=4236 RepID=A0A9R1VYU7_LACSA|nr:hypothetical protein LSAT_V11C300151740 [Lactuca sativa]
MSLSKVPQGIIDILEKIRHIFLWGGNQEKNKIHWVDWSKLWRNATISIHNLKKKPATYIARKTSTGVWRNIDKAIRHMEKINIDWSTDIWCGNSPLEEQFPTLYNREKVKCCRLDERMSANGFTWNSTQDPKDGTTLHELWQLYSYIGAMDIPPQSSFGFRFTLNPDGRFTVYTMRRCIDAKINPYYGPSIFWDKMVPLKVQCFIWRSSLYKI